MRASASTTSTSTSARGGAGSPEAAATRRITSRFSTQLEDREVILLVATSPGEPAPLGYVYARMEPRSYNDLLDACARLHDVYVDERARRRGVGEALVRETFRIAAELGAPRVVLHTASQNEDAQRLFQRAGFRTTMLEMTAEISPSRT